ncbi:MAG TPA: T9SS type A sorting domain-containing protein [Flavisolibacter sp.]|nr:T9SS type A sorting domain-containing protein [Flavisolibacter sp.]
MNNFLLVRIRLFAILWVCMAASIQSAGQGATCATASPITSSTTCTNTNGTVVGSTNDGTSTACGTSRYDVWYSFVAESSSPTITLSNIGANFTNARIQLLSACGNSSLACSNTGGTTRVISATGLTVGTTYYIRVYSTNASGTAPLTAGGFSLCVVDPAPPANDLCSGATLITSQSNSCTSTTAGTLLYAKATAGLPGACGSTEGADVWYRFVAQSQYPVINIGSIASSLRTATPVVQLLSGTACGGFSSLACWTGNTTATSMTLSTANLPTAMAPLTIGSTYYIRVTTNTNSLSASGSNWTFNICVTDPTPARVEYSKGYINVTKGLNGGTIDPGDELEIRTTIAIQSKAVDSLSFVDTLYSGAGFALVPGSIALRTNEGKVYKSFTDAFDGDEGWYYPSGTDTVIRINFGLGASNAAAGKLRNSSRPSVYNSTCIVMATYRVIVYAGYDKKITFKTGVLNFRDTATNTMNAVRFKRDSLIVYRSPGLCPNAVAVGNAIGVESNGTFGAPAMGAVNVARNRAASSFVPAYSHDRFYPGNGPQDYEYGIVSNTSAQYTTVNTWGKPSPDPDGAGPLLSYRVFNLLDIIGDHTGASDPARGNPACDTTQPVSATNPCGYMLVINSAYKADTAFQYTVSNLCPNTYYEISGWFRNICYKCGCDSTGTGASNANYIPFDVGDSSGVQPNLAFDVNGTDYYTTGNIKYFGTTPSGSDATNMWVKRGFTYLTGPSETGFTLTIRNNAPGGGGNDWAMDDLSIATCLPTMRYSPRLNPTTCRDNEVLIIDTVRSYFNSYRHFKWQRSTDGGSNWNDVPGATGTANPAWNGSEYEYITHYYVPPANTTLSNNGDRYRVVVSTTASNLSNGNCQVTDGVSVINLSVLDCEGWVLDTKLLSFNGQLQNDRASLVWTTSKEEEPIYFEVERSKDGLNYAKIATVQGHNNAAAETNTYYLTDSTLINGSARYRIAMVNNQGGRKYSRVIQLGNKMESFAISNIVNPFSSDLQFDLTLDKDAKLEVKLLDLTGSVVKEQVYNGRAGLNNFTLQQLNGLPSAVYVLNIRNKDQLITKKVVKK